MRYLIVLLMFALTSCATSKNLLSTTEIAGLRIDKIDVRVSEKTYIQWPTIEEEYLSTIPDNVRNKVKVTEVNQVLGDNQVESNDRLLLAKPEARAYIRKRLKQTVTAMLDKDIRPHFQGSRRAKLVVEIATFTVPPALQRVVIGGLPKLIVRTTLRDAVTDKVLAQTNKPAVIEASNGITAVLVNQALGLGPMDQRILKKYANNTLTWLQTPQAG